MRDTKIGKFSCLDLVIRSRELAQNYSEAPDVVRCAVLVGAGL
jgi:hypothetical protein